MKILCQMRRKGVVIFLLIILNTTTSCKKSDDNQDIKGNKNTATIGDNNKVINSKTSQSAITDSVVNISDSGKLVVNQYYDITVEYTVFTWIFC